MPTLPIAGTPPALRRLPLLAWARQTLLCSWRYPPPSSPPWRRITNWWSRSEEHTSELQSHSDLHSFPTRRSSDLEASTTVGVGQTNSFVQLAIPPAQLAAVAANYELVV